MAYFVMLILCFTITKQKLLATQVQAVQHTFVAGEENREVKSCLFTALAPNSIFPNVYPQQFFSGGTLYYLDIPSNVS